MKPNASETNAGEASDQLCPRLKVRGHGLQFYITSIDIISLAVVWFGESSLPF
jgi:hypothetical protein